MWVWTYSQSPTEELKGIFFLTPIPSILYVRMNEGQLDFNREASKNAQRALKSCHKHFLDDDKKPNILNRFDCNKKKKICHLFFLLPQEFLGCLHNFPVFVFRRSLLHYRWKTVQCFVLLLLFLPCFTGFLAVLLRRLYSKMHKKRREGQNSQLWWWTSRVCSFLSNFLSRPRLTWILPGKTFCQVVLIFHSYCLHTF